jgi:hypothetical protein
LVGGLLDPQPLRERGGQRQPAPATQRSSSNATSSGPAPRARMTSKRCPPDSGTMPAWQPSSSLVSRPFSSSRRYPHPTRSHWIQVQTLRRDYPRSATPPCAASRARRWCAAWRAAWATT